VTLALLPFRSSLSLGGFFFCLLVVVLADAAIGGIRPALTTVAVGAVAGPAFYDSQALTGTDLVSLILFMLAAAAILIGGLAQLAAERASSQRVEAGLRRVATLVARGAPPDELFAVVTAETGQLLGADRTTTSATSPTAR
jgi:hypothetical protein